MTNLIHVLNLDTVGGVEALYTHFLQCAAQSPVTNQTIVSGKTIHPMYLNHLASLGFPRPFHEQYVMGFRIPKPIRCIVRLRRLMVQQIFDNDCRWIFWNRIEESAPPKDSIYYEHGASWMTEPTPKRKRFLSGTNKILANSRAAQILLSHVWQIPKDEIVVIETPLRPDISIVSEARMLSTPIRLGYIGRLIALKSPASCLYTLHELCKRQIPATLDIAGDGPERPFLEETAQKLGIIDRVRFLGTLESISAFYDRIDLLLVPSLREPLGLVALEAAARAVPVLAAEIDGLAESVSKNRSGILLRPTLDFDKNKKDFISKSYGIPKIVVDPITDTITAPRFLDPSLIADEIERLILAPEEYGRLSQGALLHVSERSSFADYTARLLSECLK